MFGVFDGHGGKLASKWLAEHIASVLDDKLTFSDASIKEALLEADAQCCAGGEGSVRAYSAAQLHQAISVYS
jgi:serine/threonine protein phosphatase PrpC